MAETTKKCDIEWCKEIPTSWGYKRNKYVMHKIKDICTRYSGEDILSLTMQGVIIRDLNAGGKMPTTFDGYQKVYAGNLLMCLFDYDVTPRCIGLIKNSGLTSPAYSQFVLDDGYSARYYYYYYLMIDHTKELLHLAKNLRHSFTEDQIGALNVPVPPIDEQRRIADFLDEKCAEIDKLSEDIQKQIDILEEYKKSVITRAVTKGLHNEAPLKKTSNQFVGSIPNNWSMDKLSRVCNVVTDFVASGSFASLASNVTYLDNPDYAMLIRTADISDKGHVANPVYIDKKSYDFLHNSNLFGGEIILPNIGAVGDVYLVPKIYEHMSLAPNSIMIKTNYNDKYYYYFFSSTPGREMLLDISSSSAQAKFNKTELRRLIVPCPDREIQDEIVKFLDRKCNKVDDAIRTKRDQLDMLGTYKRSLIYEYVTGKKRVKGAL